MQSRRDDIRALANNEQCFCAAKTLSRQCHSWVKLRHGSKSAPLPLFPLKADMRNAIATSV
jgi:hypothetical protein